jgi:hypothetical protein
MNESMMTLAVYRISPSHQERGKEFVVGAGRSSDVARFARGVVKIDPAGSDGAGRDRERSESSTDRG